MKNKKGKETWCDNCKKKRVLYRFRMTDKTNTVALLGELDFCKQCCKEMGLELGEKYKK